MIVIYDETLSKNIAIWTTGRYMKEANINAFASSTVRVLYNFIALDKKKIPAITITIEEIIPVI